MWLQQPAKPKWALVPTIDIIWSLFILWHTTQQSRTRTTWQRNEADFAPGPKEQSETSLNPPLWLCYLRFTFAQTVITRRPCLLSGRRLKVIVFLSKMYNVLNKKCNCLDGGWHSDPNLFMIWLQRSASQQNVYMISLRSIRCFCCTENKWTHEPIVCWGN